MQLWITADLRSRNWGVPFAIAHDIIVSEFNKNFCDIDYGDGLVELHFHAMLHAPGELPFGETKKYIKTLHSARICERVEVPRFCTETKMVELISKALMHSMARLARLSIPRFNIEKFASDYCQYSAAHGWTSAECSVE